MTPLALSPFIKCVMCLILSPFVCTKCTTFVIARLYVCSISLLVCRCLQRELLQNITMKASSANAKAFLLSFKKVVFGIRHQLER